MDCRGYRFRQHISRLHGRTRFQTRLTTLIAHGRTGRLGNKVVVETARGETTVEIMEIKSGSDKAQKKILRVVEPEPIVEGESA